MQKYQYTGLENREIFWNAQNFQFILDILVFFALTIIIYGIYNRYKLWISMGKQERRNDHIIDRVKILIKDGFLQKSVYRDIIPGIIHSLISFSFFVLAFGAAFDAFQFYSGIHFNGTPYLICSFIMDLFGLLAIIGVLLAFFRRYIFKPSRFFYKSKYDDNYDNILTLSLIFCIMISGFIVEALRIAATGWPVPDIKIPYEIWSFLGFNLAKFFQKISLMNLFLLHKIMWWIHTILAIGFITYIPFSNRMRHIFISPISQFFKNLNYPGYLEHITDFENTEVFGTTNIEELKWKQIFDLESCMRCGRCQEGCPAYLTGKPLSPKKIIQDIKKHWEEKYFLNSQIGQNSILNAVDINQKSLIDNIVGVDVIWNCTNCMYCMEHCPVYIEHIPKIIDMRRAKVLMEANCPSELQLVFKNMETNSNPWGIGSHTRDKWIEDINIKNITENQNIEYLFYVGCSGSFDERCKKIARGTAEILQKAKINFAILGTQEYCCGDSAMRSGNEYLYQKLAKKNIKIMNDYGIKKIITICPHCYNMIKNHYPQLGGNYKVLHHTEIINFLIKKGSLHLENQYLDKKITFHDPCFLGRYNQIYEEPRDILKSITTNSFIETNNNHSYSFCCGGGGSRMWMEEIIGERINVVRTKQILKTNAEIICTACPFCLTMIEDGLKMLDIEQKIQVKDISEIILNSININ